MATVISFDKTERETQRKAEQAKPIFVVEMTEEQRKGMLVALSYLAFLEAKNGNVGHANELLDYNRILNLGKQKEQT